VTFAALVNSKKPAAYLFLRTEAFQFITDRNLGKFYFFPERQKEHINTIKCTLVSVSLINNSKKISRCRAQAMWGQR
jgi:hypothetical protein